MQTHLSKDNFTAVTKNNQTPIKMLKISFKEKNLFANEAIAILINNQLKIDNQIKSIDDRHQGLITKTIQNTNKFKGKTGQMLTLTTTDSDGQVKHLIIVGIGKETHLKPYQLEEIGGKIYAGAKATKATTIGIAINNSIAGLAPHKVASLLGSGSLQAAYKFDKYQTKQPKKIAPQTFNILVDNEQAANKTFANQESIVRGIYLARDLINAPANILSPVSYAKQIKEKLTPLGVDVTIINEQEMHKLGMNAMLGVSQGSTQEAQLVVMKYNKAPTQSQPICFVGKGVTFDAGGISIKPSANMGEMKYDMSGSAAVVGALKTLALRKAKANVIGIVGLVENMPGGNAQRPGDVITTMSGQTVEVLNTDAEGRLVLCDCITYLQKNFEPACIVDLATLTGAILIALAHTYAGCFANDEDLAQKLIKASLSTNEKLWRMPLHKDYDKMLTSPIADIANIGNKRYAGSATAAHFIGRFIKDGIKWAHLDIAGVAWDKEGKNPICPKGAVGFGVKLLNKFVQDNYEEK